MYQYNLLNLDGEEEFEKSGVTLMLTECYQKLLLDDPGLMHHNFGNLFSHTPVNNIADIICETFNEHCEGDNLKPAVIVYELEAGEYDINRNYVIREPYGARIVLSELFENSDLDPDNSPELFMVEYIAEKLIDDWTRGSVAKVCKSIDDMSEDLKKEHIPVKKELVLDDSEENMLAN